MDVLDKLKNDWKKDGARYPKISENEIYAMLHKRSSSIVKWILFISIIEFAFFFTISYLLSDHPEVKKMDIYMPNYMEIILMVIDNAINLIFMYLFFINYKKITNTDTIKNLMANILRTRKIVSKYIFIKLVMLSLISLITLVFLYNNDPQWLDTLHTAQEKGKEAAAIAIYFLMGIVFILVLVLGFWLFYRLIYGMLLKRLNRNYQELKKIEL